MLQQEILFSVLQMIEWSRFSRVMSYNKLNIIQIYSSLIVFMFRTQ